jgi:hypothetical protein
MFGLVMNFSIFLLSNNSSYHFPLTLLCFSRRVTNRASNRMLALQRLTSFAALYKANKAIVAAAVVVGVAAVAMVAPKTPRKSSSAC